MKPTNSFSTTQLQADTLAGIITGIMAIPLSIGICLMSDYPIYTGLYTVILAGFVSFFVSLFRVGNYTGMPGIAAGLAPALAFGVHTFGMENMPFVILLTSLFQAFIWAKRWEGFILELIPHYIIDGLLAGVGLKIFWKFVPFLQCSSTTSYLLMFVMSGLFLFLAIQYGKKHPAYSYIFVVVVGSILAMYFPFEKLSLESQSFQLILPIPHFSILDSNNFMLLLKMIGFALMLGSIDIIEQVMSNIAIQEIDPQKRQTNSNNSLLAIWIANLLATFFGGMTNLDGLAKSTTNTIAGAQTKFSNVITSLTMIALISFPQMLQMIPLFVLGIIMLYSGGKMMYKVKSAVSLGMYPAFLSILCAMLVFYFGIFEGLLLIIFLHAIRSFFIIKKNNAPLKELLHVMSETHTTPHKHG